MNAPFLVGKGSSTQFGGYFVGNAWRGATASKPLIDASVACGACWLILSVMGVNRKGMNLRSGLHLPSRHQVHRHQWMQFLCHPALWAMVFDILKPLEATVETSH